MPLEVQAFLRSFPDAATALAAIAAPPHGVMIQSDGRRALLNYGISTPKGGMYDECRALVLALPSFDVLSQSFRRFYNAHDSHAATIDWPTAAAEEKLDGSLVVFYYDGDRWNFHTRGMLDALGPLGERGVTFRSQLEAIILARTGAPPNALFATEDPDLCFVCEYVGPYNRIVTRYLTEDLYLLTTMDRRSGREIGASYSGTWPFSKPRIHDLPRSLEGLIASMAALPPLHEGYVVRDGAFHRIKVKNPSYISIAEAINAGNAPTERHYARLALHGDTAEIKGYFPEFAERIARYERIADAIAAKAERLWEERRDAPDQKTFALAVKDTLLSAWLFRRRTGATALGARDWMGENFRPEKLVELAALVEPTH